MVRELYSRPAPCPHPVTLKHVVELVVIKRVRKSCLIFIWPFFSLSALNMWRMSACWYGSWCPAYPFRTWVCSRTHNMMSLWTLPSRILNRLKIYSNIVQGSRVFVITSGPRESSCIFGIQLDQGSIGLSPRYGIGPPPKNNKELDWGSIGSSPKYGIGSPPKKVPKWSLIDKRTGS